MTVSHAIKGQPTHTHETAAQARECDAWHRRVTAPAAERPAATRPTEAERYEYVISTIERVVGLMNDDLGLDGSSIDGPRVSFGYIGNCGSRRADGTYANDDRMWMIFLPHPGRVGTEDDRIGSFRTGDLSAAQATLTAALWFRKGMKWQRPTI